MAITQKAFAERILQITGVKNFILIKEDGQILAHNIDHINPEILSSITLLCGLSSEMIKSSFGFTHFRYAILSRSGNENILIFPLKNYFLGLLQNEDFKDPESENSSLNLAEDIILFIDGIST